ncbi:hypothetical protein F5Y16DRAFT_374969 [Xylariaceae sp. FL0255]|nr:hypothetical protein F5Y16DRAFT_374969 [Xylariaceae sp. FL0255]
MMTRRLFGWLAASLSRYFDRTTLATDAPDSDPQVEQHTLSTQRTIMASRLKTNRYPKIASLQIEIKEHYIPKGSSNDETFLPHDKLEDLVTFDSVREILQSADMDEPFVKDLVDFVLNKDAKKLFVILVLMTGRNEEKVSLLADLKAGGLNDNSLPLGFHVNERDKLVYGYSLEVDMRDEQQFKVFNDWEDNEWTTFDYHQWHLMAPVFGSGKFRHIFSPRRPLPYLEIAHKPASSGFFGEVSRVVVHPAHIALPMTGVLTPQRDGIAVAIKKAKDVEDLNEFFDREAGNLQILQELRSDYLISPVAAYQKGNERCLVFPWADGGNLMTFWEMYDDTRNDRRIILWIIDQFVGITSALVMLHNKENCRHGDLKPENILCFKTSDGNLGKLQIADLGLSKFHEKDEDTKRRQYKGIGTTTPSGTWRYEPPEEDADRKNPSKLRMRSRQYDMWSMGCIMLELTIWFVYGFKAVQIFRGRTEHFWDHKMEAETDTVNYIIHPRVTTVMERLAIDLKENTVCSTLLDLAQKRLLVVAISRNYGKNSPDCRETAGKLYEKLIEVQQRSQKEESFLSIAFVPPLFPTEVKTIQTSIVHQKGGNLASPAQYQRAPSRKHSHNPVVVQTEVAANEESPRISITCADESEQIAHLPAPTAELVMRGILTAENVGTNPTYPELTRKPLDIWESVSNNSLALQVLERVGWNKVRPYLKPDNISLCSSCHNSQSDQLFNSSYDLEELGRSSATCPLCKMLWDAVTRYPEVKRVKHISLRQIRGVVSVPDGPNLLSVYTDPVSQQLSKAKLRHDVQLGLPELFKPGSQEQFILLREWIRTCDDVHLNCKPRQGSCNDFLPTRLLEVRPTYLRLVNSANIKPDRYVVLSHCWGDLKDEQKFCTFNNNLEQFQKFLDFESLPQTFRDAVTVTRGIGVRYLWIDSLCIIQDSKEDWENESTKMEKVFSCACCTIAASSAQSILEGFLQPRKPRHFLQLAKADRTIFVCPNIDDFDRDVEKSKLSQRGWVLQERVLSRRTIFFTSTQVYWECGKGVQCETLAALHNSVSAFIGDANFPESALEYYRDGRQILVQDLFQQYSKLAFSVKSDRPVAILGLQARLEQAFKTRAAFGLFGTYFARLLLWKRSGDEFMKRIDLPSEGPYHVPSWSWLSKEGAIEYLNLEFQKITWNTDDDFENPLGSKSGQEKLGTEVVLRRVLARKIKMAVDRIHQYVTFDEDYPVHIDELRCVIIGQDKVENVVEGKEKYYALVIRLLSVNAEDRYERVGVGTFQREHISDTGVSVNVH